MRSFGVPVYDFQVMVIR